MDRAHFLLEAEIRVASLHIWLCKVERGLRRWAAWTLFIYMINLPLSSLFRRHPTTFVSIVGVPVLASLLRGISYKNLLRTGDLLIPGLVWVLVVFLLHPTLCAHVPLIRWISDFGETIHGFVLHAIIICYFSFSERANSRAKQTWFTVWSVLSSVMGVVNVLMQDIYFDIPLWMAANSEQLEKFAVVLFQRSVWELCYHFMVCAGFKTFLSDSTRWFEPTHFCGQMFFMVIRTAFGYLGGFNAAVNLTYTPIPATTEEYVYKPLSDDKKMFRLLLIHPRHRDAPIRCSLIERSIRNAPLFSAVSYAWGAPGNKLPIEVDGRILWVTANAHGLLEDTSSYILPRLIWIDAICIDQSSVPEKSAQVQLMGDIYQRASFVTVWLGHPDSARAPGSAARFHASLGTIVAFQLIVSLCYLQLARRSDLEVFSQILLWRSNPGWDPLMKLTENSWFERIWVVQEAVLAREARVVYAGIEMDWDTFVGGLFTLASHPAAMSLSQATKDPMTRSSKNAPKLACLLHIKSCRERRLGGESLSFTEIMGLSRIFSATDQRDHVFGVQGLCDKGESRLTKADYALGLCDVSYNAGLRIIAEEGVFSLLSSAGTGLFESTSPALIKLPSWIPDWQRAPSAFPLAQDDDLAYAAGGPSAEKTPQWHRGRSLFLPARMVGTVSELGDSWSLEQDDSAQWNLAQLGGMMKAIGESYQMVLDSRPRGELYPFTTPRRTLHASFWRILIGDRTETQRPAPDDSVAILCRWYRSASDKLQELLERKTNRLVSVKEMEEESEGATYARLMQKAWNGRRVGILDKGYIGLFPAYAKKGDHVCVVQGGQTPFVLRARSDDATKFELVGDSFILGIMDGEAWNLDQPDNVTLEVV